MVGVGTSWVSGGYGLLAGTRELVGAAQMLPRHDTRPLSVMKGCRRRWAARRGKTRHFDTKNGDGGACCVWASPSHPHRYTHTPSPNLATTTTTAPQPITPQQPLPPPPHSRGQSGLGITACINQARDSIYIPFAPINISSNLEWVYLLF